MNPVNSYKYTVFMSYNHETDGKRAPALQSALYQVAKPWYRERGMEVFRDETSLPMNSELTPSIQKALSESKYLLLLASPKAAQSSWVGKEVAWWLEHRTPKTLLIVLTEGNAPWDSTTQDFKWSETDAVPNALHGKFENERLLGDLRFAKTETDLAFQNPKFHEVVVQIAAALNGISPEEMESKEKRQHDIVKLWVGAIVVVVLTLLILFAGSEYYRAQQAQRAAYLAQAVSTRLTGQPGQRVKSLDLLKKAAEIDPDAEVRDEAIKAMTLVDLIQSEKRSIRLPSAGDGGLVFDANFERYARTDDQGNIVVRRVRDDQTLVVLTGLKKPPAWVFRFSPNGRFLAAKDEPDQLHLWDLRHGNGPSKVIGSGCAHAFDFSPDSQLLAFSQCDGRIHIYNIASGQEIDALKQNAPSINFLAFHPNGQKVAISSDIKEYAVQIINLIDRKVDRILPHNAQVNGMTWSDDGKLLATACHDFYAYVWEVESPDTMPRAVLAGHQGQVRSVAFNHGSNLLASLSWDNSIRVWDPMSGRQLVSSPGTPPLQFSADGQQLAFSVGASEVRFWQVVVPHEYRTFHSREGDIGPFSADFSLDGQLLISAHNDGLRLWDVSRNRECRHVDKRPDGTALGYVRAVLFHPNGKDLISGGPRTDAAPETGSVDIWRIDGTPKTAISECPELTHLQRVELTPHTAPEWVSTDADGRTLAVADDHGQVIILDSAYNKQRPLKTNLGTRFVTISPNGRWVASGTWKGQPVNGIQVFDLLTGGKEPVKTLPERSSVSVAFSPDSQLLVTGSGEEYAIWKVGSWKDSTHRFRRDHAINLAGPIAFTPDGKVLAITPSQDRVKLLAAEGNWEEITTLAAPDGKLLNWLRFSHTGQLAAVSTNHVIQLWDLRLIREQLANMGLDFGTDALTISGIQSEPALSRNELQR